MENKKLSRLEKLKQATIINYSEDIDFNNNMELYDSMLEHVFNGDLDSVFPSEALIGIDQEEKNEIFQLARKYSSLCFYQGDPSYWADSIEGVYLTDLDLVSMKLLDNYDFLLRLAKDGGEDALKQLMRFQGHTAIDGAMVDYLRNTFIDDDILKDVIIEMSREDGDYKGLSDEQKAILCTYPDGILYERVGDKVERIPSQELVKELQKEYFGYESDDFSSLSALGEMFDSSATSFEDSVLNIYYHKQDYDGHYLDEKSFKHR